MKSTKSYRRALWHKIKYSMLSHIPLFERINQIKCFLQQLSQDIQTYIDTDRHENPITISSKPQTSTHVSQKKKGVTIFNNLYFRFILKYCNINFNTSSLK